MGHSSDTLLYFLDRSHGWFAVGNMFYSTADGGRTWAAGSFDSH
jgi:hypothetical protein